MWVLAGNLKFDEKSYFRAKLGSDLFWNSFIKFAMSVELPILQVIPEIQIWAKKFWENVIYSQSKVRT